MQASSQISYNFKDISEIPIEISNEFKNILEILEKKIKLTSERKEIISDRFYSYYLLNGNNYQINEKQFVATLIYEFLPFLTYQLLCTWLGVNVNKFMKNRKILLKNYPNLFTFS